MLQADPDKSKQIAAALNFGNGDTSYTQPTLESAKYSALPEDYLLLQLAGLSQMPASLQEYSSAFRGASPYLAYMTPSMLSEMQKAGYGGSPVYYEPSSTIGYLPGQEAEIPGGRAAALGWFLNPEGQTNPWVSLRGEYIDPFTSTQNIRGFEKYLSTPEMYAPKLYRQQQEAIQTIQGLEGQPGRELEKAQAKKLNVDAELGKVREQISASQRALLSGDITPEQYQMLTDYYSRYARNLSSLEGMNNLIP